MKTFASIIVVFVTLTASFVLAGDIPNAMLTVRVVDETGMPLTNMPIGIGFSEEKHRGITDSNGCFSATGKERYGDPRCGYTNAGYYTSQCAYNYSGGDTNRNRWLPWNPAVTMVVRRVINPIPMYAKHVETKIPSTNACFGFDIMVGDWVAPGGRGVSSDLAFRVDGYWNNYRDNDAVMTMSFAGALNGICPDSFHSNGSELCMSREAPDSNYSSSLKWKKSRIPMAGQGNDIVTDELETSGGYLFRIRGIVDASGNVTNAYYGKIRQGLTFGGAGTNGSYLILTYYLNPTPNDRNLEFDPKRNLFKNLKSTEQVTAP